MLALHGFTGGGQDFAPLAASCSHQMHAPDLPGHRDASFTVCKHALSIPSLATSLNALARDNRVVMGYSMGARVALKVASDVPLRGLILISGTPGISDEEQRAKRRVQDHELADHIEAVGLQQFLREWSQKPIIATQRRASEDVRAALSETRISRSAMGLAKALRGYGTGSMAPLWSELPNISCPTLLITGEDDPKFTQIAHQMSVKLPKATHASLSNLGHAPHFEAPQAVGEIITEFLSNLP